jgi:hypothetical protein
MILLFELGENNMVSLNKVWISTIPQFRRLLARDKGGPGDGSGKYKKRATREFTYIYHLLDFHSPLENYNKTKRKQLAMEFAGMPDKESELDNDPDLQDAIELYKDLLANSSVSLQTYRAMKHTRQAMDLSLEERDYDKKDINNRLIYDMKKDQESIINMPKVIAALDEMEDKVKREMMDTFEMRGGAEKGVAEDPEDDD